MLFSPLRHAHYQAGITPLALVWKDENCSQYVMDTDSKGQVPNQQQVFSHCFVFHAILSLCVYFTFQSYDLVDFYTLVIEHCIVYESLGIRPLVRHLYINFTFFNKFIMVIHPLLWLFPFDMFYQVSRGIDGEMFLQWP